MMIRYHTQYLQAELFGVASFATSQLKEAVQNVYFRAELQIPLNATHLYYRQSRSAEFVIQP